MDLERFPQPTKKEALDEKWYAKFEKIATFSDYAYLTGNNAYRENQKLQFINGEIESPTLDYPELEKINFAEKETTLLDLKKELLHNEKNDIVKQLYHWKLNEKIAELRMLRAAKEGSDKKVSRYSTFIYGKPEKEVYEYTISQIKKDIDDKLFSPDIDISSAAKRLNEELFDALMNNENKISQQGYTLPVIEKKPHEKEYSAEEIKTAFENFLLSKKIERWQVLIDNNNRFTSINVSQITKTVNIPANRILKQSALEALIAHELRTHVLRREQGERSKLKLLGLGLDRYLKGEEGIATYEEQKIKGTNGFSGLDGHLAIALAMGKDGKKRNFKEVFQILKDLYFIRSKKAKDEAIKSAEESAWNRCIRTFRGTTCKTQGACLTRDIVYREGNIGIWSLVKEDSNEVRRFSVGKYDPINPRHIWILDQLGITDDDLNNLEQTS